MSCQPEFSHELSIEIESCTRAWELTFQITSTDSNKETSSKHNLTLEQRLEIERTTFHWLPYKRIAVIVSADGTVEEDCEERPRAIEEFPKGWWSRT